MAKLRRTVAYDIPFKKLIFCFILIFLNPWYQGSQGIWKQKNYYYFFDPMTSPMCSEIFLPRSHRSWQADVLSMPSVSMAIGSKILLLLLLLF